MPGPSRKTPQRIAQMLALHAEHASAREIGEALKLNHHTVVAWLKDAGLEPNGGHGTRKARRRPEPEGVSAEMLAASAEIAKVASAPLPRNRTEALTHVRARLAMAAKLIEQQAIGLPTGASNPTTLVKLGQWERELRSEIAELTPSETPDPENDPTNVEAASHVRREIESLVTAIERAALCVHCGKNPYGGLE